MLQVALQKNLANEKFPRASKSIDTILRSQRYLQKIIRSDYWQSLPVRWTVWSWSGKTIVPKWRTGWRKSCPGEKIWFRFWILNRNIKWCGSLHEMLVANRQSMAAINKFSFPFLSQPSWVNSPPLENDLQIIFKSLSPNCIKKFDSKLSNRENRICLTT